MELRRLVSRRPTRYDRRGVLVSIIPEGRARAESAMKTYAQEVRTHYLGQMSRQQMIALSESHRRINTPLKASEQPARFRRF